MFSRCSSEVGHQGRWQVVSLGAGCVYHGIVLHEFLHALGFWHEQARPDRDLHVWVNWINVLPNMTFNFEMVSHATYSKGSLFYPRCFIQGARTDDCFEDVYVSFERFSKCNDT